MSGCSEFTHGVRFKIQLTPFDFAQGRLRQARGERHIESNNGRFLDNAGLSGGGTGMDHPGNRK